jgi:hypothetical protein
MLLSTVKRTGATSNFHFIQQSQFDRQGNQNLSGKSVRETPEEFNDFKKISTAKGNNQVFFRTCQRLPREVSSAA